MLANRRCVIAARLILAVVLLLGLGVPAHKTAAQTPWPAGCIEGELSNPYQKILTCFPASGWNGTLFVYAHGFVPPQAPLELPAGELSQITLPDGRSFIEVFLSLGFAFATSSYSKNGYAVEQAGGDLNALVSHFNATYAPAQKVLVVGASEGGLITTMLVERFPQIYAGGMEMCGPVGGGQHQVKYLGDFRAVFDYYFPQVFDFGVISVPPDAFLNWETGYAPAIAAALSGNANATRQLFNVTRAAQDPANLLPSQINTALEVLFYSVWETNDLLATAGGNPYENRFTWYFGSSNDWALNRGVERVASDLAARDYLRRFYLPSGALQRPLVALHTSLDPQVPFNHELIYFANVLRRGSLRYFTLLPVSRYGHCTFQPTEVLAGIGLLLVQANGPQQQGFKEFMPSLPEPYKQ